MAKQPDALTVNALQRSLALPGSQWNSENGATFRKFTSTWDEAMHEGLDEAAFHYRGALRSKLREGYTTGDYVTGKMARSLKVERAHVRDGVHEANVYSKDFRAGIWEFGAWNAFTRKFERVEHWRHTLEEEGSAMSEAFHRAFTKALGA